jgi:hypothetical protein
MKASLGDRVELRAPAKTEHLEIIAVEYAPIPMIFAAEKGTAGGRSGNAPPADKYES